MQMSLVNGDGTDEIFFHFFWLEFLKNFDAVCFFKDVSHSVFEIIATHMASDFWSEWW